MWYNKEKLTHWVCSMSLSLMIYMFILIRTEKDRYKIGSLVMFTKSTLWGDRKENGSKVSLRFLLKCSPPCYFYNKIMYNKSDFILTVPLSILFFLCSQSIYYNRMDRHLMSSLLSTIHHAVTQNLLSIVNSTFHHAATQILVTAPNL